MTELEKLIAESRQAEVDRKEWFNKSLKEKDGTKFISIAFHMNACLYLKEYLDDKIAHIREQQ